MNQISASNTSLHKNEQNTSTGFHTCQRDLTKELHHATHLLAVLANGTGNELLTKADAKSVGAHPFSESTRRRKIKEGDYPSPIMLSGQMSLWRARDIVEWLKDPTTYRVRCNGVSK